jgi:hypothetical protein
VEGHRGSNKIVVNPVSAATASDAPAPANANSTGRRARGQERCDLVEAQRQLGRD